MINRIRRSASALAKRISIWASPETWYEISHVELDLPSGGQMMFKRPRKFQYEKAFADMVQAALLQGTEHLSATVGVEQYGTNNMSGSEIANGIANAPLQYRRNLSIHFSFAGQGPMPVVLHLSHKTATTKTRCYLEFEANSYQRARELVNIVSQYTESMPRREVRTLAPFIEPISPENDAVQRAASEMNRKARWSGGLAGLIAGLIPAAVTLVPWPWMSK